MNQQLENEDEIEIEEDLDALPPMELLHKESSAPYQIEADSDSDENDKPPNELIHKLS